MNLYNAALSRIKQAEIFREIQVQTPFNVNRLLTEIIEKIDSEAGVYIPFSESRILVENGNIFLIWTPPNAVASNAMSLAIHFAYLREDYEIIYTKVLSFYAYINNMIGSEIQLSSSVDRLINAGVHCVEYNKMLAKRKKE